MKTNKQRQTLFLVLMIVWGVIFPLTLQSKEFIIYSILQDFPMGTEGEKLLKNFYVNIGEDEGIKPGTQLDVFRVIGQMDPYESKKQYTHTVKIGELEVIHSEQYSSIGKIKSTTPKSEGLFLDIKSFMIGDKVAVKIK